MLITILFFLLALNAMIFVHELGHLLAAKWADMPVDRFSIGFGPEIVGLDWGETRYSLSAIPMGGYVNIDTPTGLDPEAPLHKRMITISAGVIMNIVLAFVMFASLPMIWGVSAPPPAQLSYIDHAQLPAEASSFQELPRDLPIEAIDGKAVEDWQGVSMSLLSLPAGSTQVQFEGGKTYSVVLPAGEKPRLALARSLFPTTPPITGKPLEGTPAQTAGFQPQDRVVSADGKEVVSWRTFMEVIRQHPGEAFPVQVQRAGKLVSLEVTPSSRPAEDVPSLPGLDKADDASVGWIGLGLAERNQKLSFLPSLQYGLEEVGGSAIIIKKSIAAIAGGPLSVRQIAGPIAIADMSDEFRQVGWDRFLWFMGMLSVNLAIINFLPLPALDGGYMLMLLFEGVRGRKVPERVMIRWNQVGFAFLSVLMVLIIVNDIFRVMGG